MFKKLSTLMAPLLGTPASDSGRNRRQPCRFVPGVEILEDRRVMSITDYTQVAQMFPRHVGPTNLYLNFDGWQAQRVNAYHVSVEDADPTTNDRERDIQDILFRVSEIFSPFDVQVRRMVGNGVHATSGGHSTIFLGDNGYHGNGTENDWGAYTPLEHADYPGLTHGVNHVPNSNPFDVGFVDPYRWDSVLPQSWIVAATAHEAGHTFGLGHVLSFASDSTAPEIMSYDNSSQLHFSDQTLLLTDENAVGSGAIYVPHWGLRPEWGFGRDGGGSIAWVPNQLLTQNSYRILEAVVGARLPDDYGNVANEFSVVGPTAPHTIPATAGRGRGVAHLSGTIERYGDYDVFGYQALRREYLTITVRSGAFLGLQSPEILVYNALDQTKAIGYLASGKGTTQITLALSQGEDVTFVVGGLNGSTVGTYGLTVASQPISAHGPIGPGGGIFGSAALAPVLGGLIAAWTQAPSRLAIGAAPVGLAVQRAAVSATTAAATLLGRDAVFTEVLPRLSNRIPALALDWREGDSVGFWANAF